MRSSLYKNFVYHERFLPKPYKFGFKFFWFNINLDELEELNKKSFFFSHNRFNFYSYNDNDHFGDKSKSTKENVLHFLKENGVEDEILSVNILTSCRVFGYVFNPVSYYFIQGVKNVYAIIEICNTFNEIKPYFVPSEKIKKGIIDISTSKNFYISPFSDIDNYMNFKVTFPSEKISVHIDDFKPDGRKELVASLRGELRKFSDAKLFGYLLKFPLITFRIITMIHVHALFLYLKGIPFFPKKHKLNLQRGYSLWK
jgi:DUF1365 family protein